MQEPYNGPVGKMKGSTKWLASEDFIGMEPVKLTISGVFKDTGEVMQDGKKKDFGSRSHIIGKLPLCRCCLP